VHFFRCVFFVPFAGVTETEISQGTAGQGGPKLPETGGRKEAEQYLQIFFVILFSTLKQKISFFVGLFD
jgi:hypothetical protein